MTNANDAKKDLYQNLRGTKGSYDELHQKVQDTELGKIISTVLACREENIVALEKFLVDEGVDVNDPPADKMVTSATPNPVMAA